MTSPTATTQDTHTTYDLLETALENRQSLTVTYHGHQRVICPHALGWKNSRPLLLAYQTGGHTSTGTLHPDPTRRWRCLNINDIEQLAPSDQPWQTAPNYRPDRPFPTIDHLHTAIPATG